jgi:hypothetical protein
LPERCNFGPEDMQHHLGELATQQPRMALQITPARAQLGCASAFLSRRKPQNDLHAAPKDCLAAQHPARERSHCLFCLHPFQGPIHLHQNIIKFLNFITLYTQVSAEHFAINFSFAISDAFRE